MTTSQDRSGSRPVVSLPAAFITAEILIVMALSLGRSAVYSIVALVEAVLAPEPLAEQAAALNTSRDPNPWIDLTYQLLGIGFRLVPVVLACYLLVLTGISVRERVFGVGDRRRDWLRGIVLTAAVGSVGLGFYLATVAIGINLTVVASGLPDVWWREPVLILSALQNAVVEEVLVVGYLFIRLRQLGWGDTAIIATSALLRGAYHLYQGFGGGIANAAMGVLFGWLYCRWGRVMPLIITHTLLDWFAFIGYAVLVDRVDWL